MNKFSELILVENKRASVMEDGSFVAYTSTFGPPPDLVGDIIEKNAFSAALEQHKRNGSQPALLWNHDTHEPIGTWLNFVEDDHGLLGSGRLTLETRRGREAAALMKDGALAMSIGFNIAKGGSEKRGGIRYIKRIGRLGEISLVALPANPAAKIVSKSRPQTPREYERQLRDALGLSAREAKRACAGGWGALVREEQPDLDRIYDATQEILDELRTR